MTRKVFEAAIDCTTKIKGFNPSEEQIKEMLSIISKADRLFEIGFFEGRFGVMLEAKGLSDLPVYERTLKEGIAMWFEGASIDEASDYAADRYFEEDPAGYDAAVYFAVVFCLGGILKGESSIDYIDGVLQYFLPDGWRWYEEDEKEKKAHEGDKNHAYSFGGHRHLFLGDNKKEIEHRFDDIKICDLITQKDQTVVEMGERIADQLTKYKDGTIQLIMKKLTYQSLAKALYALPPEAEDRIISNLSPETIAIIKTLCILNKDSVSSGYIQDAAKGFEEAINAYDGDPDLEAGYE